MNNSKIITIMSLLLSQSKTEKQSCTSVNPSKNHPLNLVIGIFWHQSHVTRLKPENKNKTECQVYIGNFVLRFLLSVYLSY